MDSTAALVAAKVCLMRAVGSGFSGLPGGLQNTVRKGACSIQILLTPLSALVLDRRVDEGTIRWPQRYRLTRRRAFFLCRLDRLNPRLRLSQ